MRTFKFGLLFLLAFGTICFSHLSISFAKPTIQSAYSFNSPSVAVSSRYYPITGDSASELRSQMAERGPIDKHEGRRYDANTEWVVKWSYRYAQAANQCKIRSVTTSVAVTFTLPKWKVPTNVEPSLIADWNAYSASLRIHEEGHKLNGVNASQDILQALKALPAYSSCKMLERSIRSTSQAIIQRYNQRDLDYDEITRHGYTQGAVFPPVSTVSR